MLQLEIEIGDHHMVFNKLISPSKRHRFCVLVTIQLLLILVFTGLIRESITVDIKNTKQITVIVDEVQCFRFLETRFNIYTDSEKYIFANSTALSDCSNSSLCDSISRGDELTIVYFEKNTMFGKRRIVVGAKTDIEVYRSIEGYNASKRGASTLAFIISAIIELVFIGICWINNLLHKNL